MAQTKTGHGSRRAKRRGGLQLPPSWAPANIRRVQLLSKRRTSAGLSHAENAELEQLQDLTRRYLDSAAPISVGVIEDLKRAVQQAEERGRRPRTKAS